MKQLYTLLFCFPFLAGAQTIHPVQVGGSTAGGAAPFYSPQSLTIDVGDIVRWTNTSGTHNVNGTTTLFPGNPEGFTSGSPASGNWSFQFTFTIAGVYNYHCTQQGHSATQFGTITVVNTTSVNEAGPWGGISLYPNPTENELTVELGGASIASVHVIAADGRVILSPTLTRSDRPVIDLRSISAGMYWLRLTDVNGKVHTRSFVKR